MKKILVIAAHPDDELLGCGATIINHALKGDEVFIHILGEGQTSRFESRDEAPLTVVKDLSQQSKDVAKKIQAKKLYMTMLPDNRFDSLDLLDIIKKIEQVKNEVSPDIVYTHHAHDLNIDHQKTFSATLTAFRPKPNEKKVSIFCFETLSSTECQFSSSEMIFKPNRFIVIDEKSLNLKTEALAIYNTEICEYPHPRSLQAVRNLAMYRGNMIGCEFAEAFEVIRDIQV